MCEIADIYNIDRRKARKEYRCYECWAKINKGEKHAVHSILFEGSWDAYRYHEDCAALLEHLVDVHREGGDCITHGEGYASAKEILAGWWGRDPDKREDVSSLRSLMTPVARRILARRREKRAKRESRGAV